MHIPDGYLDPVTSAATFAVAIAYYASFPKLKRGRPLSEDAPLITTLAAGIFAAQMLNWPIPGGTSLHFVGGALAAAVAGPFAASVAMLLVLFVQCIVFHDGGITALGANVLNMAIVDVWAGYAAYKLVAGRLERAVGRPRAALVGGAVGGWLGITLAGALCGVEIGFSPSFPYGVSITVPIMAGWHALLGLVEGAITGSVAYYLALRHPELLRG